MEASLKLIELTCKLFRRNEIVTSILFCALITAFGVIFHYFVVIPHHYNVPISILVTITLDTLIKLLIPDTSYWKKEAMLLSHVSEAKINKELTSFDIPIIEKQEKKDKEKTLLGKRKKKSISNLIIRLVILITIIIGLFSFVYSGNDAKGRRMIVQFYKTLDKAL